jgi:hypothetical protein
MGTDPHIEIPAPMESPVTPQPVPLTPQPAQPVAPTSNADTIATFLETTLTTDGSLSTFGTPQFMAYNRLVERNPELNPSVAEDQIEITQRYSLNVLFFATEGLTWANQDGWTSALDLCVGTNWIGVTCDNKAEVIGVKLVENGLFGVLPSEIRGLPKLKALDLGSNLLVSVIPDSIGDLTSLGKFFHFSKSVHLVPANIL